MKRKRGRVLGYRTIYSSQNALRLRETSRVLNQSSSRVSHLAGLDCQHYHRVIHIANLRFQNDSLTRSDADSEAIVSNYRIATARSTNKTETARDIEIRHVLSGLSKLYYSNAKSLRQTRSRRDYVEAKPKKEN